jgi:hypothetical protein
VGRQARGIDRLTRLCTPDTPLGSVHGKDVDEAPHVALSLKPEGLDELPRDIRHDRLVAPRDDHMEGDPWLTRRTGHDGQI